MGDFNVNWLDEVERRSLYNVMINENGLEQHISIAVQQIMER